MKTIDGYNGINVVKVFDDDENIHHVTISLDSELRTAIEFVNDFKRMSGVWQGFDLAKRIHEFEDFMVKQKEDQWYEAQLRLTNPAVAESYKHYQTMLALAKEHPNG
jgi:hypothetical protein